MINLEEKGDGDSETVKENDKQSMSIAPLESRRGRKRARDDDSDLQNISAQMEKVAAAVQRIYKSKLDVNLLYQEVMRIEGFEEGFLGSTFDHLVEHENLAKGFLAKNNRGFGLKNSRRAIEVIFLIPLTQCHPPFFSFR